LKDTEGVKNAPPQNAPAREPSRGAANSGRESSLKKEKSKNPGGDVRSGTVKLENETKLITTSENL